jgi:hypothetical protein
VPVDALKDTVWLVPASIMNGDMGVEVTPIGSAEIDTVTG